MPFNPHSNPYVSLMGTIPEILIPFSREQRLGIDTTLLDQRLTEFSSVAIEIGSGSGQHLIAQAQRSPTTLWIGFEIRYKRAYRTADRVRRLGLKNVLVIQLDAMDISPFFKPGTLDAVYVLFPEPWDKRRWLKNRIVSEVALTRIASLLKDNGLFHFKTDHREYFDSIVAQVASLTAFEVAQTVYTLHAGTEIEGNIESEFEQLFRGQSHPTHLLEARKRCNLS